MDLISSGPGRRGRQLGGQSDFDVFRNSQTTSGYKFPFREKSHCTRPVSVELRDSLYLPNPAPATTLSPEFAEGDLMTLPDAPEGWESLQSLAQEAPDTKSLTLIIAEMNRLLDEHHGAGAIPKFIR